MEQHRPEVIDLVEKHFPECVAAQSDVEWESDMQLVVYVDMYFLKADPRYVSQPTCAAFCADLREGIKKVFKGFAKAEWAESIAIRIMLSFIEAGEGSGNAPNRQN